MPLIEEHAEATEASRSAFVRALILEQPCRKTGDAVYGANSCKNTIPKKILRYWHDPSNLPDDVRECMESWEKLSDKGFQFFLHDDTSATEYIANNYGKRESAAFSRCRHPAMRSDYFRLCFIVEEGGFYVDADDVLIGEGWHRIFECDRLKLQPLCYNLFISGMMRSEDIWNPDISAAGRIYYVNNDPLAAPAKHPLLMRALSNATDKLLSDNPLPDIQATTGPGNLTLALIDHVKHLRSYGRPLDFYFLQDWDSIAEMRWQLSYREDERNWRNVYGC